MADVVISYAREDHEMCARIHAVLAKNGFSVWYDQSGTPGRRFRKEIRARISGASALVVLWSSHSIESHWVPAECQTALNEGKLIQLLIADCTPPLPFEEFHFLKLPEANWEVSDAWFKAVAQISALARQALVDERDALAQRVTDLLAAQQERERMTVRAIERNGYLLALDQKVRARNVRMREQVRAQARQIDAALDDAKKATIDLRRAEAECESLTAQIVALAKKSDELAQQLSEKLNNASAGERELSEVRLKASQLQTRLENAERERDRISVSASSASIAYERLRVDYDALKRECEGLELTLNELRERTATFDALEAAREEQANNLELLRAELGSSEAARAVMRQQLDELERAKLKWPWGIRRQQVTF